MSFCILEFYDILFGNCNVCQLTVLQLTSSVVSTAATVSSVPLRPTPPLCQDVRNCASDRFVPDAAADISILYPARLPADPTAIAFFPRDWIDALRRRPVGQTCRTLFRRRCFGSDR